MQSCATRSVTARHGRIPDAWSSRYRSSGCWGPRICWPARPTSPLDERRARGADHQRHSREIRGHLRARLGQRRSAVTTVPVVRVDPDPHVHLVAVQLAEYHADLLVAFDRDEPGRLLGIETLLCRTDFVLDIGRGRTRTVAFGADLLGTRGEDIAVRLAGERAQHQAFARAG